MFAGESLLMITKDKFFEVGNIYGNYVDLHVTSDFIFAKEEKRGWVVVNLLESKLSKTVQSTQLV